MKRNLDWPFFDDVHRQLTDDVTSWSTRHLCGAHDSDHDVDNTCRTLVKSLGTAGWLRYCVAAQDGGALPKIDARAICLLRETLAYRSALADFSFAMQGLGSAAISLFGNTAQKSAYLPRVANGAAIAAFALSEDEAGSDAAALRMTAVLQGEMWILNGEKTWISNGGVADFYVVFARSEISEKSAARGISAFIVDAATPGLSIVERIETLAPHPMARLRFDNCRLSANQLIGEPGKGFRIAMQTLDLFRISVAAAALGFARRAYDETLRHVQSRRMFGAHLADMQMTQATLADMATAIDAAALLTYRAAWQIDQGHPATREAAMAKLFATENAQQVIDAAVQLFGARGVRKGEVIEALYREIRALRIYEGASEIQKLVIARAELNSSIPESATPD
ncbi:MAG TPA: acyl-CoA dehydrogenase family protein [Rhodocyclaceae bacterium]|nr:acyl-CoA dehydrogenase family protein [Rhodocyclaceae bacterium]